MEILIPIFRLVHFIGLALLLGGTVSSFVLVRMQNPSTNAALAAWNCMHLVAVPGLVILMITGILHSSSLYWEHFKGAGYMHAKILLAAIVLVLMIFDMRTQKNIIRNNPDSDTLVDLIKKRQAFALGICSLVLLIMWLISYRPF